MIRMYTKLIMHEIIYCTLIYLVLNSIKSVLKIKHFI